MLTLIQFSTSSHAQNATKKEDRIARLADAAYRAALAHRPSGSFVDLQLGIWSAIRSALESDPSFDSAPAHEHRPNRLAPARARRIR